MFDIVNPYDGPVVVGLEKFEATYAKDQPQYRPYTDNFRLWWKAQTSAPYQINHAYPVIAQGKLNDDNSPHH